MTKLFQLLTNKKTIIKSIGWGLIIGLVLTFVFTLPLLKKFSSHLPSKQDGMLITYLINWGSFALEEPVNYFNVPFFHPQNNTIAYSDLFFSSGIINIPIRQILKNFTDFNLIDRLVISHNIHLLGGLFFCFLGQYLLSLHLFKKKIPSLICATIFTFSWFHFQYLVHLHTLLVAGIPFYFLFLMKYFETKANKYLFLGGVAFLFQALNSPLSAYFLLSISFSSLLDKRNRTIIKENIKTILLSILGVLIIIMFFYYPYLIVSSQFNYTRSLKDAAHSSFPINQLFSLEILFYSVILLIGGISNFENKNLKTVISICLIGLIFMLGPVIKINEHSLKIFSLPIPLPYSVFYYLIPGLKAFRATSRWGIVFIFGLSLLVGLKLSQTKNHFLEKQSTQLLLLFSLISLFWINQVPKMNLYKINNQIPLIYETIKSRPEQNLAEFPTYVWSQTEDYYKESYRLFYQSYHQKRLYNGYSGFIPKELEDRWHTISEQLDNPETIQHLKESEVQLILLNLNEKSQYNNFNSSEYQLIKCLENNCLYLLKK